MDGPPTAGFVVIGDEGDDGSFQADHRPYEGIDDDQEGEMLPVGP